MERERNVVGLKGRCISRGSRQLSGGMVGIEVAVKKTLHQLSYSPEREGDIGTIYVWGKSHKRMGSKIGAELMLCDYEYEVYKMFCDPRLEM